MLFTYVGDPDRYYPTLGITPVPGQDYDLAADPGDGRWEPEPTPEPAAAAAKKTAAKPAKKEATDA